MRMLTAAVAVCLALPAQQDAPVFKTTTQLVEFTVVALDKKGNPVTDLRKDEIVVQEKGKSREVAFFRFEGEERQPPKPEPLPAGVFSNRLEYSPGPPRNISAIVLDTLNSEPTQMVWARAQVTRSLRKMAPRTRVAVYHLGSKLNVIHDFTDDMESLRERVAKSILSLPMQTTSDIDAMARDAEQLLAIFENDPIIEEMLRNQLEVEGMYNASVRQRKLEMTLSALEALGQHLAGIPGRKNLVWIGGGISMLSITGAMGFGPHGGFQSFEDAVNASARKLAQQGIALYVVDSRGLATAREMDSSVGRATPIRGRGRFERQQQAEEISADPLPAAYSLADVTGGRVIKNTNDPSQGLSQAVRDVLGAYSVGFYSLAEPDGKWNRITVKSKRPGVRLSYRQGFLAEQPAQEPVNWTSGQWQTAVQNPVTSSAVTVDASCQFTAEDAGLLALTVQVDPSTLSFRKVNGRMTAEVDFGIAEKKADGTFGFHSEGGSFAVNDGEDLRQHHGGLFYSRKWRPAGDVTTIRVIVRDRLSGRHGTLDLPFVKVPRA
ncbi:MAG: VWA domain-containing protein, partial [Acidobacteria bacterium]|nr:VWA domain-containing protein [Acidobacteriota bacterium]